MKLKLALSLFAALAAIMYFPMSGFLWNSLVFIGATSATSTILDFLMLVNFFINQATTEINKK